MVGSSIFSCSLKGSDLESEKQVHFCFHHIPVVKVLSLFCGQTSPEPLSFLISLVCCLSAGQLKTPCT